MPFYSYVVLSFIVPAYNEEVELPVTIESIRAAADKIDPLKDGFAVANNYEIIVVDDASTDRTANVARDAGVEVVAINRRQIAAARNAGANVARGDILFFVDADTRISRAHVAGAVAVLNAGHSGGSARVVTDGRIPLWGRVLMKIFCAVYFANNLGAGAFLFTTRENFDKIGGFDEELYIGEEVYFSLALRKLGRFKILREPILTSGRKLRMYSAHQILFRFLMIVLRGKRGAMSRDQLELWYEGKRETKST